MSQRGARHQAVGKTAWRRVHRAPLATPRSRRSPPPHASNRPMTMFADLSAAFTVAAVPRRSVLIAAVACAAGSVGVSAPLAMASDDPAENDPAAVAPTWRLSYDSPKTQRWRIGLRLDTNGVTCKDALATFPIPMAWPEQTVRLVNQDIDPRVDRWELRDLPGGARQVVLTMPHVPAGSTPEVFLELEVTRSRILPPEQTDDLVVPKRPGNPLKNFLGVSPYIDTGDSRIRAAARELAAQEHSDAWSHVEAIYDWIRERVEYIEGDIKTASQALRDGTGDCEEMTSLFVAVCRATRIPARMVWIPDHCYPEFYLEDAAGNGTWFPCQAAGTRQFGMMDEYRPVLQKGDRFKIPENRQPVRYVAEFFRCIPVGNRDPRPIFVREVIEG
jgi:hypothetical protein